jgi:hypothetical protein
MTPRPYARTLALAAACLGLAVPAAIAAPSSGSGPAGGSGSGASSGSGTSDASGGAGLNSTSTTPTPTTAEATPVGGPVSASADGFTLSTTAAGTFRRALTFSGSVPTGHAGELLAIQRESAGGTWENVAETTVADSGSFSVEWRASRSGLIAFRASLETPTGSAAGIEPPSTSPELAVTIYKPAIATIYGPGFYGHKTACGETLRRSTLGVASRTLKCGTKVSIDFHGRSIELPVIDRGPYGNGASWDLTEAAAQLLSDPETETIGAAVL